MNSRRQLKDFQTFWSRYEKNRPAIAGLIIASVIIFTAIAAPIMTPFDPLATLVGPSFEAPLTSAIHPFGTDSLGRDIFSGIIYGARTALMVGLLAASTAALIGTLVGMTSGFYGGKTDDFLMRMTDGFMVIPIFFLALILMAFVGQNIRNVIVVIGLLSWPPIARLVRADFISIKEREFVEAARVDGTGEVNIMLREILPNVIPTITVIGTLQIAAAILLEAGLSFLGLGDPNVASWGVMLRYAQLNIYNAWYLIVFPGIAITLTALAFNMIGDGLNDALNPKLKER
ncbi:MAG TPA: ABC transporter permease [Candidatus Bathyarchaeia archaeon]|nr:ABC transporter permease [Candidatus Bathyarchaeia archaeon]